MAPVTHLILVQFKEEATPEQIQDTITRLLQLKENCIHPTTGKPYIVSTKGGKENSLDGLQDGITHAFVTEFATAEDREFYTTQDPVHLNYVKSISSLIAKLIITDFTAGEY